MENDTLIDLNSLPDNWDPKKLIHMMKQQKIMMVDSTHTIDSSIYSNNTTINTTNGIYSQMKSNPLKSNWDLIEEVRLENKCLQVRILVLEGVFTKEEGKNIRSMLLSNDEASVTLANTILENAEED